MQRARRALLSGGVIGVVLLTAGAATWWDVGGGEPPSAATSDGAGSARVAVPAAWPDPAPVPVGARLLPNLTSLPAEEVSLQVVEGTRELRFAGILANPGGAPLETVPDPAAPCPDGQRHVSQVLYHDADGDGGYDRATDTSTTTRPLGCMLFHPEHDHWHVDSTARYALTRPGEEVPVVSQDKVSFCLRDNRALDAGPAAGRPEYYGECERDTRQGISAGWADVYQARLPSQKLDLPADLPDGTYCLHTEADPYDLILETDDTDNRAVVPVVLAAGSATAGAPGSAGC